MKKAIALQHGINLGGWLSQCEHTKQHYDSFICEADIEIIASWKLDHIRVPFDYELIQKEDGTFIEDGFLYLDECIVWARKFGLNIVLDLHKTAGYDFNNANTSANSLFTSEELQEKFLNVWSQLAKRYSNHSDFIVFELLNEIVEENNATLWNALAAKAIKVIREYTKDMRILIGGIRWNSVTAVASLDVPADEHIIYNFHCYEPMIFTHQKAYWVPQLINEPSMNYPDAYGTYKEKSNELGAWTLPFSNPAVNTMDATFYEKLFEEAIAVAEKRNVALYCGEYGVIDQAPISDTLLWYKDICETFDKFGIGRAAWTYKKMDFGITGNHYKSIYEDIIKLL